MVGSGLRVRRGSKIIVVAGSVFFGSLLLSYIYGVTVLQAPTPESFAAPLKGTSSPSTSISNSGSVAISINPTTEGTLATNNQIVTTTTDSPGGLSLYAGMKGEETCLRHSSVSSTACADISTNKKLEAVREASAIDFSTCGAATNYAAPMSGTYLLQVWGAQGGTKTSGTLDANAKGGYSVGTVTLAVGDTLQINVGCSGGSTGAGGWNGGGAGFSNESGSGGGATDIRINGTSLTNRIIVAGGGGGHAEDTSPKGGYGGGLSGSAGGVFNSNYTVGGGGTQNAGGAGGSKTSAAYFGNPGQFGVGGDAQATTCSDTGCSNSYKGGGGGGGWFGGGAGATSSDSAAGGGGSGYVFTSSSDKTGYSGNMPNSKYYLADASTVGGNTAFVSPDGSDETGHAGDGYAKVTPPAEINNGSWGVSTDYSGPDSASWLGLPPSSEAPVWMASKSTGTTTTTVTYGAKADTFQGLGTYQNTVVYTVIAASVSAPTITSVRLTGTATNASGPTSGGTVIDVNGTNLDTTYQVFIDKNGNGVQDEGEQCTSPNIVSATKITCTTPAHSTVQARDVVVNTWGGSATMTNGFSYVLPLPTITSITPNTGHFRGGETVVIAGKNLAGATTVRIGANASTSDCQSYVVNSDTQITCVISGVPSTFQGGPNNTMTTATTTVSAYVTTPAGTGTGTNLFTYRYLNKSATTTGSYMEVLGVDIAPGSKIYVNGVLCTNQKITSNSVAACNAPITTAGTKTVTIQPPPASAGTMQNWAGCSAIPTPNYATTNWWKDSQYTKVLTDNRNGQNYRVRKMPDGRCWMIDNLKLGNFTLTSANSDVATNFTIPENPVQGYDTHGNGICVGGTASATGTALTCNGSAITSSNFPFVAYTDPSLDSNANGNIRTYKDCLNQIHASPDSLTNCGYLYNWYTATAGTGTWYSTTPGNATSSICPAGWSLPTGGYDGQFAILNNAMSTGQTTPLAGAMDAVARPNWRYNGPFEGTASGSYSSGFPNDAGEHIYYWSSTWEAYNTSTRFFMRLNYQSGYPGSSPKAMEHAVAVRCIKR